MDNVKEQLERLLRWQGSFWPFVTECLGHRENKKLGWKELVWEHKDLCRFLEEDKRFKLILMPRYSLKSCIGTVGYSLWRLVRDENIRILIYSDSASKAEGFLGDVKNHILGKAGNSLFRENYNGWENKVSVWNQSQVVVSVRQAHSKEPSVDTGGIESSKVGMHYDLIIFDDIVSDLNTTTKAQMDKVWDCYRKSLSLLKPGGDVVVIGTRWNWGDAYGRIIEEDKGEWGIFHKQAIVKCKEGLRYPFKDIGLGKDFLQAQKERQGSYFFSALYQNDPTDDSTALFRREDFRFYKRVDLDKLYVTCTCDPAGSGGDYTAFTVVGTDKEYRMYLLYARAEQYKPHQIVNEIIRLSYGYKFIRFGIETNTFNGMLERDLKLRIVEERKNKKFKSFGVETLRSTCMKGAGKHARILSLQPIHERGDLLFEGDKLEGLKGDYAQLVEQMVRYTHSHRPIHDDLVDSLSLHVQLSRKGQGDAEDGLKEGSIASIIETERVRMNSLQGRLPRKYRHYYEPVFG